MKKILDFNRNNYRDCRRGCHSLENLCYGVQMTAKIELVLQVRSDPYSDTVRPGTKIPQGMTSSF